MSSPSKWVQNSQEFDPKNDTLEFKIVNWLTIVIAALILKNSYQIHYGEKYTLIRMQTEVASLAAFLSAVCIVILHSYGY
jgi:hypothetical protein